MTVSNIYIQQASLFDGTRITWYKAVYQKSRIRETKHLSTDADSNTDTKKMQLVGHNSPNNKLYTLYEQKFTNVRPLLAITFPQGLWISLKCGHWNSGSWGKKMFKQSEQMKKSVKKKTFFTEVIWHPLLAQDFKSETTSLHYFSRIILSS